MKERQPTTALIGACLLAAVAFTLGCASPEGARLDGGAGLAGAGPTGGGAGAAGGSLGTEGVNTSGAGGSLTAASCPGPLGGAGGAAGSTNSTAAAPPSTAPAVTVSYVADMTTVLPNPERGFHSRYEIVNDPKLNPYLAQGNTGGSADRTFAGADMALGGKNVIIHSYVHLDPWIDSPHIDGALMANLAAGLAAVRAHKKKIVLRFAYTWASNPSASTEATIMNHIDDLAPFINANADVILHLEAGMLGEWGEWHDGPMADWNTQASFDSKYRIVKKMLQTWDARLPILIRYPLDSHEILTRTMPPPNCALANGCLLTQAEKDRVGFHNDCVLADPADQGTYDIGSSVVQPYTPAAGQRLWVQDSDPAFRASYGGSKMVGGESCDSAGDDPTDCSNALATWKTFQWTEINEDYAPVNTSVWKAAQLAASGDDPAETCWIRMKRKLGYRLRVVDATFPKTITLGESHAFSGHLSNDGWASPVKARPAFVVLDRPGGPDRFVAPLADVDVRRWKSGAVVIADERFVPTGLAPGGGYRLSLWLPDPAQGLQADPSYAIALANIGIWDASTGLNVLATDLTVVASAGNRSNSSRASGCSATQDGGAGGASGSEAAANDGGTASPERDSGGSVGTDSAAGTGGSAGGGLWGPNGPKKQFSCPAPPYAAQMSGASTDVCANFTFNYNWSEGPTWIASEGAFFFSNYPIGQPTGGDILKYTPGGGCEIWLHDVGCNGLGVSPSGNLLAACQSARAVMEYDVKTKVGRQIATMVDGKMLDTPNDLIARSDGNIYFSNRTAENGNRPVGLGPALVRIDPFGVTSVIQAGDPNGVALSPDETKLYVVGMGTWTLDAQGVPGQKGGPTPGGDGIAVDCAGNILVNGTNSAFGGADGKTLLVVGGGTMARTVMMTVAGMP